MLTITSDNFEREVLKSDKKVLVDFWASWCGPCRMLSPIIDEVAKSTDKVKIGKVNVDEESDLATKFAVMSIPTLILFENGKPVKQIVGVQSKEAILKMIE